MLRSRWIAISACAAAFAAAVLPKAESPYVIGKGASHCYNRLAALSERIPGGHQKIFTADQNGRCAATLVAKK